MKSFKIYANEQSKIENIIKKINSKDYYEVTTSHGDWGNDSWESLHIYDICSDECLSKMFDEYLKFKSNTKKLEIEKVSRKAEMS